MKKSTLILILLFNILNVSYPQNNLDWHNISPFIPKSMSYDPYRNNLIWLAGTGGLFRYDINTNQWKSYTNAEGLSKIWASTLYVEENTILVGTESGGANIFNIQSERFIPFLQSRDESNKNNYYPSVSAFYPEQDKIWIGTTEDGLYLVDKTTLNTIKHFTKDDNLGENCIFSITDDGQYLWLATAFCGTCTGFCPATGGITRLNKTNYEIQNFKIDSARNINYFNSLALTGDTIWAAGQAGLFTFEKLSGVFTPFLPDQIQYAQYVTIEGNYIWCVANLSGSKSLIKIDRTTHSIVNSLTVPVSSITAIPGSDDLYLTSGNYNKIDLYRMNKSTFDLQLIPNKFLPGPYCYGVDGSEDTIYAGSGNKIVKITDNDDYSYSILQGPDESIRDIVIDGKYLWVCTNNGLFRYINNEKLELQQKYFESEIVFYAVCKDDYLWVSTHLGLYKINKTDGQITKKDLETELNTFGAPKISELVFEGDNIWLCFSGTKNEGGVVSGILKLDNQTLSTLKFKIFPVNDTLLWINNLIDKGDFFLTSGKEIYKINKSDLYIETFINQWSDKILLKDNLLWTIIHQDGIKIFDINTKEELIHLEESNGLLHDYVTDLFIYNDNVYFTTYGGISIINSNSLIPGYTNEVNDNHAPEKFMLFNNYPNPFNPATKIRYTVPSNIKGENSNVKISVYDILGNEIATLVNKEQQPGEYEVDFVAGKYSSGIYFYVLNDGENVISKKMVLLK